MTKAPVKGRMLGSSVSPLLSFRWQPRLLAPSWGCYFLVDIIRFGNKGCLAHTGVCGHVPVSTPNHLHFLFPGRFRRARWSELRTAMGSGSVVLLRLLLHGPAASLIPSFIPAASAQVLTTWLVFRVGEGFLNEGHWGMCPQV